MSHEDDVLSGIKGRPARMSLRSSDVDRHDHAKRNALARRILAEFDDMPGLALSQKQAGRFLGIDEDACSWILAVLTREGRLRRNASMQYVRAETPCVIEGGCRGWPATRWTIESLSARVGDVVVKHKISATGVHPNFAASSLKEMFATGSSTLREFLGSLSPEKIFTGDEQFLLRVRDGETQVFEPLQTLLDDVEMPVPADRRALSS